MSMLIFPFSNLCIISGVILHNCFWVLQLGVVVTFLNTIISCLVFFFFFFDINGFSIQQLFLRRDENDLISYSAWNITGTYRGLFLPFFFPVKLVIRKIKQEIICHFKFFPSQFS